MITKRIELEALLDSMRNTMSNSAIAVMDLNVTPDGMHTKELLNSWLNNIIIKEESKAQIEVMNQRKMEYREIYKRFAPLGSTRKRLEREIDVAEKEYLENLRSYNQARLHKFNMVMSSNLKVIDAPFYPASPEKSKRVLYLIISIMSGVVLSLSIVIVFEMLNDSLKSPTRAAKVVGEAVAGTIPLIPENKLKTSVHFDLITPQALNLFFQQIRTHAVDNHTPFLISLFSTELSEGKSFIMHLIKDYIKDLNMKILMIAPISDSFVADPNIITYDTSNLPFFNIENIDQLCGGDIILAEFDFIFIELPSIIHNNYHPNLIKSFDMNVLVCNATRTWTQSDKRALKTFKSVSKSAPEILLNGVSIDVMEEVIGQVPKSRSKLRQLIKKLFVRVASQTFG